MWLWANMEWALTDFPGVHDIVAVCAYDVARFSASIIMDVQRIHPFVIVSGVLQGNPFCITPDEFLRELRSRRARPH